MFAGNNVIQHAMFQQELATLKTFRQFLTNGLLNDAGAGKSYQRAGFGNIVPRKNLKAYIARALDFMTPARHSA